MKFVFYEDEAFTETYLNDFFLPDIIVVLSLCIDCSVIDSICFHVCKLVVCGSNPRTAFLCQTESWIPPAGNQWIIKYKYVLIVLNPQIYLCVKPHKITVGDVIDFCTKMLLLIRKVSATEQRRQCRQVIRVELMFCHLQPTSGGK